MGGGFEEQGLTSCNLSTANASQWYGNTGDGYARGNTPRLGAVACYGGGLYGGAGHVCMVEAINGDGSITCSESNYSGPIFQMRTIYPPYELNISGLYFQGFIYPPTDFDDGGDVDPVPPPQPPLPIKKFKWWYERYVLERRKNGKL